MICRAHNQPQVGQDIDAMVCWMSEASSLRTGAKLRHQAHHPLGPGPGEGPALPARRQHAAPRRDADELALNEIGRVTLRTTAPLFFDEYRRNRDTGSFILIDEATNATVAAGMILGPTQTRDAVVGVDRRTQPGRRLARR